VAFSIPQRLFPTLSHSDQPLVGDARTDMEAGRRAGVHLCAVRHGYGVPAELARWKPDFRMDDLRELVG
jgi:phosphoglycolate phosphatase-like HAD superfamily hydrolase